MNNNNYHSNKREPPPFFIRIPILGHVLVHSVDKTHVLGVVLEFFFSTLFQHRTKDLFGVGTKLKKGSQDSEEAM